MAVAVVAVVVAEADVVLVEVAVVLVVVIAVVIDVPSFFNSFFLSVCLCLSGFLSCLGFVHVQKPDSFLLILIWL